MRVTSRIFIAATALTMSMSLNAQWTSAGGNTTTTDKVGIGTSAPGETVHIFGNSETNVRLWLQNPNNGENATSALRVTSDAAQVDVKTNGSLRSFLRYSVPIGGWAEVSANAGNGLAVGTTASKPLILGTANTRRVTILETGEVGIGTPTPSAALHVVGNVQIDGTVTGNYIKAHYQDVAEWVPSKSDLAPGTVVVLDPGSVNSVAQSAGAYDTTVAGVVSAQPGIILGVEGASKEQIATTGRVRVKADTTNGPIAIGDLLVTSDRPGYAMKSVPVLIQGRNFHQPGTIIGKALEALPDGSGEILVLLSLQ